MSISSEQATNPTKRFLKWKGDGVIYWDKEAEKEVSMPLPFDFVVLDQLTTIAGWSDQQQSAFWSNEVRATTDEISVRTKNGVQQTGAYKDLGEVRAKGAKYAKSIYLMHDGEIYNFKAVGAALSAWIEFTQENKVYEVAVSLTGSEQAKKGATTYYVPKFEAQPLTKDVKEKAIELDKKLQEYLVPTLGAKFQPKEEEPTKAFQLDTVQEVNEEPIDINDIPF